MTLKMIMNLKMAKNLILWNRLGIREYMLKNKNHNQRQI